jgi:hypothetical protein
MKMVFAYFAIALLLGMGLVSTFRPTIIQSFAIKHNKIWLPGIRNPFYEWMKTADYLVAARIMGVFLIFLALGLGYALSLIVFK